MTKEKTKAINKGVHFNLSKPMDKKLFDYVTDPTKIVNYSSFMKGLIYEHMKNIGEIDNPYQMGQPMNIEPVAVKVAPAKVETRRVIEEEPEEDDLIEEPKDDAEEVDEPEDSLPRSNALANFGAMSAQERRAQRKAQR